MDRGLADVVLILISTSALKGPSYPIGHGQGTVVSGKLENLRTIHLTIQSRAFPRKFAFILSRREQKCHAHHLDRVNDKGTHEEILLQRRFSCDRGCVEAGTKTIGIRFVCTVSNTASNPTTVARARKNRPMRGYHQGS